MGKVRNGATTLTPGDDVIFSITVTNQGTLTSGAFTVTDIAPAELTYTATGSSADNPTFATNGANTINLNNNDDGTFTFDDLASGDSVTFDVAYTISGTFAGGTLVNRAEISADSGDDEDSIPDNITGNQAGENDGDEVDDSIVDPDDEDDHDPATITVERYDLALGKVRNGTGTLTPGDDVIFSITVTNQGSVTSGVFTVTDIAPAELTYTATGSTADNATFTTNGANTINLNNNDDGTFTFDDLASGDSVTFDVAYTISGTFAGGNLVNRAEISADSGDDIDSIPDDITGNQAGENDGDEVDDSIVDPDDEDDHDPATITVERYDLALGKVRNGAGTLTPGDDVIFSITVTNQGTLTSGAFTVTDIAPAELTYTATGSTADNATFATNGANTINLNNNDDGTFTFDDLASGDSVTFDVAYTISGTFAGGNLVNRAEISADSGDDEDSIPDNITGNQAGENDGDEVDDSIVDLDDEDDHDPATITVERYDLALGKVRNSATTLTPGDDVIFSITVTNQGTLTSGAFTVTDIAPAELTYTATGSSADNPTFATNGANTINLNNNDDGTFTFDDLASGDSVTFDVAYTISGTFAGGSLVNRAEISADSGDDEDSIPDNITGNQAGENDGDEVDDSIVDPDDEDDHDPATITVERYDLALGKVRNGTGTLTPGDDVIFSITVTNQGTLTSGAFTVTDIAPAELTYTATGSTADNATFATNGANTINLVNNDDGTFIFDDLASGDSVTFDVAYTISGTFAGGNLVNRAEISADSGDDEDSIPDATTGNQAGENDGDEVDDSIVDPDDEDDHDPATITVERYDLALGKVRNGAGTLTLGDTVIFSITVTNQGTLTSGTFTVTDIAPTELTYTATGSTADNATFATNGANTINLNNNDDGTFTFDDLASGDSVTFDVAYTISLSYTGGTLVNRAEISADSGDDEDSTPDALTNQIGEGDGDEVDDSIVDPDDEDDHDPDTIFVTVYDLGDLPDSSIGGTPNYATTLADSGPIHEFVQDFRLGATWDNEVDGQPSANADGDDTASTDDEDGVTFPTFTAGQTANVTVSVNLPVSITQSFLNGFIDWNGDGDFGDAGETATASVTTSGNVNLAFAVPADANPQAYARFRLSESNDLGASGNSAADGIPTGEVEDYLVSVVRFDLGDLPDSIAGTTSYPTLFANSGARHTIEDGYFMGASVDAEGDGQPTVNADGDDTTGTPDDEDGVTFPTFTAGQSSNVTVQVTSPDARTSFVVGLIDWNGDGDFLDSNERVEQSIVGSGTVTLNYSVPDTANTSVYARFRLSETSGLVETGDATSGEVEDYLISVNEIYRVGNLIWLDTNNNGTADTGENGINGIEVRLYQSDNTFVATTTTAGDGNYSFDNLGAGDYYILIPDGQAGLANLLPGEVNVVADPDNDADNDNNGDATGTGGDAITGLTSGIFTLGAESEPDNEQLRSDNATDDDVGFVDNRSNYSVDIGYTYAYRLGNLVWFDDNNNGQVDVGEAGVDNITVELYDSGDNFVATTTTSGGGFYNFTNLEPGNYYAFIPYGQTNIFGYTSSTNGEEADPNSNGDNNDNGVTDVTIGSPGVRSGLVTLGPLNDEPVNEVNAQTSADDDNDTFPDNQSHYALDFGFTVDYDYGDNPDSYNTANGNTPARHPLTQDIRLGATVDGEPDAETPLDATGDDANGDDEDGVTLPTLITGGTVTISVDVHNGSGSTVFVQGWIDWNGDGDFDDANEQIATNVAVGAGTDTTLSLPVSVPADATTTPTFSRFRISTSNTLGSSGDAPNGEVEDYPITIQAGVTVYDYGDNPDSYDTTNASGNPARHELGTGLLLGSIVDDETDAGTPLDSTGDDVTGSDDEDSVTFPTLVGGSTVNLNVDVNNPTSDNAFLQLWIDFNADGDFDDAGEQVATNASVPAGSTSPVTVSVNVPATVVNTDTYARLRLSTQSGLASNGDAPDGEVEDYVVTLSTQIFDFGDAPDSYATDITDDGGEGIGPSHALGSGLLIGTTVDDEADGQPVVNNTPADGDDTTDTDDEDGVNIPTLIAGQTATISVDVTNPTGSTAFLQGWIDWDDDGVFDAGDQIASNIAIPAGTTQTVPINITVPAGANTADNPTYARFRVSTTNGIGATGQADDGEVEDYEVSIQDNSTVILDFGDAPDTISGTTTGDYQTLAGDDGPSHILGTGIVLGSVVDDETDGQPNNNANGDDNTGSDDEDGVTFPTLVPGSTANVTVNVNNPSTDNAFVQVWIDFNADGDFDDADEQVATNELVPAGSNAPLSLSIPVPASATVGSSYARLRISTDQDLASTGATPATDGEVEDHLVTIGAVEYDYGDSPDGYNTLLGSDGARHQLGTGLQLGDDVDAEADGQPNAGATGDDNDGNDDEDGVTFPTLVAGSNATISIDVDNPTTEVAYVQGWIDWNNDGDWDDADEQIILNQNVLAGSDTTISANITVPTGATTGTPLYARFRVSTTTDLDSDGEAIDGEVEDYTVTVQPIGTPVYDYGDNPESYVTLDAVSGAKHLLGSGLIIGSTVDDEPDGQPAAPGDPSTLDDLNDTNDEDGVTLPTFIAGNTAQITVQVNNPTADVAYVQAWIDWNGDGDYDDADEQIATNQIVTSGQTTPVTLTVAVPAGAVTGVRTYSRFRISTTADLDSAGTADDGEVEDYDLIISAPQFDWGDAPDSYATDDTDDGGEGIGPSHTIVDDLRFGVEIDNETDGAPNANADGDDTTGTPDDEDGIDHPVFVGGATVSVDVTVFNDTGNTAFIQGWIDWDNNGVFDEGNERVAQDVAVPTGTNGQIQIDVTVPDTVISGTTYARWRLSTDTIPDPTDPAVDGEVEDYLVETSPPGISIVKTDGRNSLTPGQTTTYTITITNSASGTSGTGLNIIDTVPTTSPNGYDPSSISWTCTASGGASCVSGSSVTSRTDADAAPNNPWEIDEVIDIPFDSTVVYEVTATLYDEHEPGEIVNEASIPSEDVRDQDINGVIYDPPSGQKVGVVEDDNIIEWTMVWINDGSLVAQDVEIIDTLGTDQTYVSGSLNCSGNGVTTVDRCEYDAGSNSVIYEGSMGPDGAGEETPDDSLIIVFRVIVPGPGEYPNNATLNITGGANAGASVTTGASVEINNDGTSESTSIDPVDEDLLPIFLIDPAIVKFGSPEFAQAGEIVTWTITVTNPNDVSISDVGFTDNVPEQFEILNTSGSGGQIQHSGNTVTATIPVIQAKESLTFTVVTRAISGISSITTNIVTLDEPYNGQAQASIVLVQELPATGETPWYRTPIILGILLTLVGSGLGFMRLYYRRTE